MPRTDVFNNFTQRVILEIKAVTHIPEIFYAQLKNYLKCTHMGLGMLIHFGMPSLTYKRIINLKK